MLVCLILEPSLSLLLPPQVSAEVLAVILALRIWHHVPKGPQAFLESSCAWRIQEVVLPDTVVRCCQEVKQGHLYAEAWFIALYLSGPTVQCLFATDFFAQFCPPCALFLGIDILKVQFSQCLQPSIQLRPVFLLGLGFLVPFALTSLDAVDSLTDCGSGTSSRHRLDPPYEAAQSSGGGSSESLRMCLKLPLILMPAVAPELKSDSQLTP